ncbi:hypothetical protein [Pandoraea communis]|uniref:hypothetical protein n=1 Tax=Pandoraea communis TaxID=2508297 RepID=UPI0025A51883|nr:hypothetical protein [Pandoraea communis]MDM8356173.1 hypothetical protein [Pandoraea communis]
MPKAADYIHTHLYGCVNALTMHLMQTGQVEAMGYWNEREIFSWWLVSDNMAYRLAKAGYCVLNYEDEIYLWGRTTHGIAIGSDNSLLKALELK